ncbi:TlpA family protein disulfide reductase [Aliifodinibius salipaludis]|nr:TlpA disulfide reductase family protein [Aliifodinibius salipaludis]
MRKYKHIVPFWPFVVLLAFGFVNESIGQGLQDEELLKDVSANDIQEVISSYKGDKAVLINVWATWCAPCIEEFPHIVELQQKYEDDLHVVFVSADFPKQREKALEFLRAQNVDWPTYFKTGKDQPFIEALSDDWSGALPFTKILNNDGAVVASWEQGAGYEKFERFTKKAINN